MGNDPKRFEVFAKEPERDLYSRFAALKALHDAGCKICVSIEPHPTPNLINQNPGEIL